MNPYRYFSLIFSYPTGKTLDELRAMSPDARLAGFHAGDVLETAALEDLQAEYTRLFISAYPRLFCPPYESFYREGVVYGNASIEVGDWYRKHGLDFSREGQPPDLLSAELDYLAITNDGEFLERMKEWIFKFTAGVKEHAALYAAAADELECLLKQEQPDAPLPVG